MESEILKYDDVIKSIERKYNVNTHDYNNKWLEEHPNDVIYLNFWHWMLDNLKRISYEESLVQYEWNDVFEVNFQHWLEINQKMYVNFISQQIQNTKLFIESYEKEHGTTNETIKIIEQVKDQAKDNVVQLIEVATGKYQREIIDLIDKEFGQYKTVHGTYYFDFGWNN